MRQHPVKKWMMTTVWRIQQVAALATLALTALNFAIMIAKAVEWRDGWLANSWFSTSLVFSLVMLGLLTVGWLWDKKFKMWNEQTIVTQERTPFYAEKLTPAGIYSYMTAWIPMMDKTGTDSKAFRALISWNLKSDPHVLAKVQEMLQMTTPETAEKLLQEYL